MSQYDTACRALAEARTDDVVDHYDAADDFAKSIDVAYEAVRERVVNGPWTPKPVA